MDFNKYDPLIAVGTRESYINIYDIRNPQIPVSVLPGHRYGISRVRFSPFSKNILVSSSYDMSVKVWDISKGTFIKDHKKHREFVYDV